MSRLGTALLVPVLTLIALPATGQDCASLQAEVRHFFASKVAGNGITWRDALKRLVAQVDSLDLDSGDTSTVLTWNVDEHLTAKASLVNEPKLFEQIKQSIGDNADLLTLLSDQVEGGDDWTISIDYNYQKEGTNLGLHSAIETAEAEFCEARRSGPAQIVQTAVQGASSASQAAFYGALVPLVHDLLAVSAKRPRELTVSIFVRERDPLVGRNESGASLKYTYGFKPKGDSKTLAALVDDAFEAAGTHVGVAPISAAASAAFQSATDPPTTLEPRLTVQAEWKELDEYSFDRAIPTPVTLAKDESLTATVAYGLEFKKDGATVLTLPRYEVEASYEDVDKESVRQSRFLAKLRASIRLQGLGEESDLTFGLVYADKPEYLAEQEFDEQLSANLAVTFKFGRIKDQ